MELTSYSLQLSGHRPLFVHKNYLLKPLQEKEYKFYRSCSQHVELLPFMPVFYGITDLEEPHAKCKDEHAVDTGVSGALLHREVSLSRRFLFIFFFSFFLHDLGNTCAFSN